jgi:hypothetical protein
LALAASVSLAAAVSASPPEGDWRAVDQIFESSGRDLPGGVRRYGWPRTDLHVTVGAVAVEPSLALGSWAAFLKSGPGDETVTMGDLVLLSSEVEPVLGALESEGFEILAIHNHLIGENPRILYVHFHGHGEPGALAKTLKAALAKTRTPMSPRLPGKPSSAQEKVLETLQSALGRTGAMSGAVLQVGVPRAEPIRDADLEIPPAMGLANAMNFQAMGANVATTGDFVLVADEVNPVLRRLRAHGIAATALHSHMLRETPRLFFLHFWAVGAPEHIGAALKAVLSEISTR